MLNAEIERTTKSFCLRDPDQRFEATARLILGQIPHCTEQNSLSRYGCVCGWGCVCVERGGRRAGMGRGLGSFLVSFGIDLVAGPAKQVPNDNSK